MWLQGARPRVGVTPPTSPLVGLWSVWEALTVGRFGCTLPEAVSNCGWWLPAPPHPAGRLPTPGLSPVALAAAFAVPPPRMRGRRSWGGGTRPARPRTLIAPMALGCQVSLNKLGLVSNTARPQFYVATVHMWPHPGITLEVSSEGLVAILSLHGLPSAPHRSPPHFPEPLGTGTPSTCPFRDACKTWACEQAVQALTTEWEHSAWCPVYLPEEHTLNMVNMLSVSYVYHPYGVFMHRCDMTHSVPGPVGFTRLVRLC